MKVSVVKSEPTKHNSSTHQIVSQVMKLDHFYDKQEKYESPLDLGVSNLLSPEGAITIIVIIINNK